MYWKELTYGFKRYGIYLVIAVFMAVFLSKFTVISVNIQNDVLKVMTVKNDMKANDFLKKLSDDIQITSISDIKKGLNQINSQKNMDVFVYFERNSKVLQIVINPKSSKSKDIDFLFRQFKTNTDYQLNILEKKEGTQSENERYKNIFNSFFFILTFVCVLIPYKMFVDESKTLKAIILSPVKNNSILTAKILSTSLIFSVACLYFLVSYDLSLNVILILFLVGLLYSLFGILFGIFSDRIVISFIFYPILIIITILPMILNNMLDYVSLINTLNNDMSKLLLILCFQILIFLILFYGLTVVFKLKLRSERIG